jgi:hypothetical protein
VIKRYAGLPAGEALRIVIPHGLELGYDPLDAPYYYELARLPVIGYYDPEVIPRYRQLGIRNLLWPMAAPFVYAARLVADDRPSDRRGTIFFPSHSTGEYLPNQDFAELADRLLELPDAYQPVTVCLYFWDLRSGAHEPFAERGLRVVSAGHVHDPQFLFRLRHLLVDHEHAASNDLGSSSYFAIHAGCRYFHLADASAAARADGNEDARATAALSVLERLGSRSPVEQRREADRYLGSTNALEPIALRGLLRRAKQLDLWGVCVDRDARPVPITVSRPWRSWFAARWLQARQRPA